MCFDQKHAYNTASVSLIKPVKIIKSHGNSQFGGSFGYCVRCGIVGALFYMSLKIRSALWESPHCDK